MSLFSLKIAFIDELEPQFSLCGPQGSGNSFIWYTVGWGVLNPQLSPTWPTDSETLEVGPSTLFSQTLQVVLTHA